MDQDQDKMYLYNPDVEISIRIGYVKNRCGFFVYHHDMPPEKRLWVPLQELILIN